MSLDASEQALASFTEGEEQFQRSWTVDTINRGLSLSPPGFGGNQTIGLTDSRLLWLDENLEEVALDAILDVETKVVRKTSAPVTVRIGAIALVLGIVGTPALWLLTSLSILEVLAPLAVGLLAYVSTTLFARYSDQTVETEQAQHYLRLRTDQVVVQIYAEQETVEDLADAIEAGGA